MAHKLGALGSKARHKLAAKLTPSAAKYGASRLPSGRLTTGLALSSSVTSSAARCSPSRGCSASTSSHICSVKYPLELVT